MISKRLYKKSGDWNQAPPYKALQMLEANEKMPPLFPYVAPASPRSAFVTVRTKVKSGPATSNLLGRWCAAFSLVICSPMMLVTAALLTPTLAQALVP